MSMCPGHEEGHLARVETCNMGYALPPKCLRQQIMQLCNLKLLAVIVLFDSLLVQNFLAPPESHHISPTCEDCLIHSVFFSCFCSGRPSEWCCYCWPPRQVQAKP